MTKEKRRALQNKGAHEGMVRELWRENDGIKGGT